MSRHEFPAAALAMTALVLSAAGCARDDSVSCSGDSPDITRPDFWTRATHCRGVAPDFDRVFDEDTLHEFHITISPEHRAQMMEDMDEKFSGPSTGNPDLDELPTPIWVPVTVEYDGYTWTQVGMRWKGHSSLKAAWNSGVRKLAFLLRFDLYEETWPNLENQRFFGFKKLCFSNAYNDPAIIREKVAYEIFRSAGVEVPHVAFAPVYLDWQDGSAFLGIYTLIEDPSDVMMEDRFKLHDDEVGNLYKPYGEVARWYDPDEADGGPAAWVDDVEAHFEKCTNEETADWSDISKVIERLHGDRSIPSLWRSDLEEEMDVDSFLRTLAVNQVIMNWDSYGCMHHNYYVYSDLNDHGRFVWMPWDLNEAMLYREQSGCPEPGSVMLDEIVYGSDDDPQTDVNWPIIRYLLSDSQYRAIYIEELRAVLDGPFERERVISMMRRCHDLVAPYVVGPEEVETYPYSNTTTENFEGSLTAGNNALEPHVDARREAVETALEK